MKVKTINFKFKEDKFWYKLLKKLHLYSDVGRWSNERFNEILDVLEKELAKRKSVSLYVSPDVFTILNVMNNRANGPLVIKSPYPDGAGPANYLSKHFFTIIFIKAIDNHNSFFYIILTQQRGNYGNNYN